MRQSGSICKCLEEYHDDLCVADELRKVGRSFIGSTHLGYIH